MADFRKLLLVLIAGAFLFAAVASADNYSCNATSVPTLARSEGLAEQMGDVLLKCSGTVPAGGLIANIRLTLTTYITNREMSGKWTDAMMILDEGLTAASGTVPQFKAYPDATMIPFPNGSQNVYQAVRISDTEVEWQAVVLAGPGSVGFQTIRLTNVRGNANRLGDAGNATIQAYINVTAPTAVQVNNNLVTVADTRVGMTFDVGTGNFKNCVIPTTVNLKFTEGFSNAFRPQGNAAVGNTSPGGPYPNESGWNPGALQVTNTVLVGGTAIGQAYQGTRLMIRVKNNPSGTKLVFPNWVQVTDGNTVASGMWLGLISTPNADGSGGSFNGGSQTSTTTYSDSAFMVVYEVYSLFGNSISFQETVKINVTPTYTIPGPLGTVTASGTLAPLSTIAKDSDKFDDSVDFLRAYVPRFVDKGVDKTWFVTNPCRTVLLFPYITQQGLFDTGIAISNTTLDPWGTIYAKGNATVAQAGACRLFYYGNTNGAAAPAMQTSPTVAAGGQLVFQLSGGGGVFASGGAFTACAAGNCVAPLFQGYLFAVCDFQFAHGYAFISDYGAQKLAQGYLALVVPDVPFRLPQLPDITPNAGEQLNN